MKRQTRPERPTTYEQLKEQERLILEATEVISRCMQERGVSKAELARRVGRSRAYLTQVLSGSRNMTLRTLADLAHALDCRVTMSAKVAGGALAERPTVIQLPRDAGWEQDPAAFVRDRRRQLRASASWLHGFVQPETDVRRSKPDLKLVG